MNKKVKTLAFVGNSAWSMLRFRGDILRHFIAADYEVHVIAPYDSAAEDLKKMGCSFHAVSLDRKGLNPLKDIIFLVSLVSVYLKIKPFIVFHYTIKLNIYGPFAAFLARAHNVSVVTGLGHAFIGNSPLSLLVSILYKFSFKFANSVWFLNDEDCTEFTSRKILNQGKCKIMAGEGIRMEDFPFNSNFPNRPTFLFIGRLLIEKGILEFVQAAEKSIQMGIDADFLIVGAIDSGNPSSVSKDVVESWAKGSSVRYLGTSLNVAVQIEACTCLVLPSYREGLPRVVLEASSMGRIVIASDVPGCRDCVVEGKTGFLIKRASVVELVSAIEKTVLLDRSLLVEMGARGHQYVRELFSIEKITQFYDQYICENT